LADRSVEPGKLTGGSERPVGWDFGLAGFLDDLRAW
jgi:hypothetical protein